MSADDVYQAVTDRMVRALEQGVVPWRVPWTQSGRPRSMSTGRPYRGVNTWLLSLASHEHGWWSPWFGTYRQIQEQGGQVRKGERATLVTFWKKLEIREHDTGTSETTSRSIPMLRRFAVFNADQADGLPARFHPGPGAERPIARPQAVLDGYLGQRGAPRPPPPERDLAHLRLPGFHRRLSIQMRHLGLLPSHPHRAGADGGPAGHRGR